MVKKKQTTTITPLKTDNLVVYPNPDDIQSQSEDALEAASAIDGVEHGITFGRDANGLITQAPMRTGGVYNVPVTTNWPGAFASTHNHVFNTPPSSGDIYTAVTLITRHLLY